MRLLPITLLVAALLLLGSPAASQAACTVATPAAREFFDLPLDAEGSEPHKAPEVYSVQLRLQSDCTLTVSPVIHNRPAGLGYHDRVFTFLDTDGNPGTGSGEAMWGFSPGWGMGSDRAVARVWDDGDVPMLGAPAGDEFAYPGPALAKVAPAGFAANVDTLGIAPGTTIRVWLYAATSWLGWGYWDDAHPTGAAFTLPVHYSTAVPTQPVTPDPTTKQGGGTGRPATQPRRCRVPKLRGRRLAPAKRALRRAHCKVGRTRRAASRKVRKGRVVRTQPAAGRRTAAAVRIIVSRGL